LLQLLTAAFVKIFGCRPHAPRQDAFESLINSSVSQHGECGWCLAHAGASPDAAADHGDAHTFTIVLTISGPGLLSKHDLLFHDPTLGRTLRAHYRASDLVL
jgi:hypothetical protein